MTDAVKGVLVFSCSLFRWSVCLSACLTVKCVLSSHENRVQQVSSTALPEVNRCGTRGDAEMRRYAAAAAAAAVGRKMFNKPCTPVPGTYVYRARS